MRVRLFSKEYFYNKNALCKVPNSKVGELGGSRAWVRISFNNKTIYRIISGSGDLKLNNDMIELDWDSLRELGISDLAKDYEITLTKTGYHEKLLANLRHPDAKYSIPLVIALISLFIGIICLIIAIFY